MVEHGTDINKDNEFNETPLYNVFESGNKILIKYLVELGANINKIICYGNTLLFIDLQF